jgi:hypothetical protein
VDSLIGVVIQDMTSTILAFGISDKKLLKPPQRHFPVAINIIAAELQIELVPLVVVRDRG